MFQNYVSTCFNFRIQGCGITMLVFIVIKSFNDHQHHFLHENDKILKQLNRQYRCHMEIEPKDYQNWSQFSIWKINLKLKIEPNLGELTTFALL